MGLAKEFEEWKSKFDYVTSIIGEEYLQKELRVMYDELVDFYDNKEWNQLNIHPKGLKNLRI